MPLVQHNLLPHQFEQVVGQPSQVMLAIVYMIGGIAIVWLLEKVAQKKD